jgi:hypothetical protein
MSERTLYQVMLSDFMKWQNSERDANGKYAKLWSKANSGKATYPEAQEYSRLIAGKWSELLKKYCGIDSGVKGMTSDQLATDIKKALEQCYRDSSYYSSKVQAGINQSIGLNIKAVEGKLDKQRILHLIEKLKSGESVTADILITTESVWMVDKPVVENISMAAVTDTIQENARLHTDAGLYSYIERKQGAGGCCEWCASVSGRYIYGEQPYDFFKIHKHCNCQITYMPSRKRWQNITFTTDSKGKIRKNIEDV